VSDPFSLSGAPVVARGLYKMFVLPHNLSIIDEGTEVSYKENIMEMIRKRSLTTLESNVTVMGLKLFISVMHWLVLALGILGMIVLRFKDFGLLIFLSLGYIIFASIGYGSVWKNDFQDISSLSGFLFPFLPFFAIFALGVIEKRFSHERITHNK